ncbi:MAG: ATP-binding cassette domain-containing protein [Giesbergeria sp.]|nr:ATP-binding cassette domain-containing protein [Giesbergeria sp.]
MAREESVIRFEKVSFGYGHNKPILDEVDFPIRRGMKLAVMGQNGAGKSTIFALMTGALSPDAGLIHRSVGLTVATAKQVIPRGDLDLSVREFFEKQFSEKVYDIDPRIDAALEAVDLKAPFDRTVRSFSGGQQARLLLASALIQNPDLLLLDEPTEGIQPSIIKDIAKALNEIRKMRKITIVVSEQVLSFAMDVADRLFVIEGGRLVHETERSDTDLQHIKSYLSV